MAAKFLLTNYGDVGTLSNGSWRAQLPLANIRDKDIFKFARSTNTTTGSTQFRVDTGANNPTVWSMFALVNHNMTTAAQWQIVITNSATDVVGERIYDSGLIQVWTPTATFGQLPWGVFTWDGISLTGYPTHPIALHIAPNSSYGRYVFIYITDTTNAVGYVDIGRFLGGDAWTPKIGLDYGFSLGWVDPSEVKRTLGGRRLVKERPKYRVADISFSNLESSEAYGAIGEWMRLGKGHDILFITDSDDALDRLFKRTIYASLADTTSTSVPYFDTYAVSFQLEELI
jgi:hypothetical protein